MKLNSFLKVKQENKEKSVTVDSATILYIRIAAAIVLFILGLFLKFAFIKTILYAISAAILSYDIIFEAIDSIESRSYFAPSIIVLFVTFSSFLIGFGYEGAALVIIYQLGGLLFRLTSSFTKKTAAEMYSIQDNDSIAKLNAILGLKSSTETNSYKTIKFASERILAYAIIVAILYAIVMPFLTTMRWNIAIHRALTMIVLCTPISVCVAIPVAYYSGLCAAGKYGVIFRNAKIMEHVTDVKLAFIDKAGVLSSEYPYITDVSCQGISDDTFLDFLAHSVYYSAQPFANAISNLYKKEYQLELISDFEDKDGIGVSLKINDAPVIFAKSNYFISDSNDVQPDDKNDTYCLYINNRLFGSVTYNYSNYEESFSIISSFKKQGITRCVLLTDEDKNESEAFTAKVGADEFYCNLDLNTKLQLIKNYKESMTSDKSIYIYSSGIESHTASDIDIRVGEKGKNSDMVVKPDYLANLPSGLAIAKRTKEIFTENAIFAFSIKALLFFLTFLGCANIWFAIFIDVIVMLATVLNCSRVETESLVDIMKYKLGRE